MKNTVLLLLSFIGLMASVIMYSAVVCAAIADRLSGNDVEGA